MQSRLVVLVLLVGLTGLPPGAHAAKPAPGAAGARAHARTGRVATPFADLVKAVRKKDRAALERLAARVGPARLLEALQSADTDVVGAALALVPLVRGGVLLTGPVAERLGAQTPDVAVGAARALGELLDGSFPSALEEWEVAPDAVARACGGLRALAGRLEAPPRTRLAALDALASAREICTATAELAPLLRDPVPAVRRAAALLLRPQERPVAAALREVIRDPDPGVASAAVAAVCRAEPEKADVKASLKKDPLWDQSTAAARTLAAAKGTPPEDAVEMLACLAAAGTPADRTLLDQLRQGPPSPLRDRAAELAEGGARVMPR